MAPLINPRRPLRLASQLALRCALAAALFTPALPLRAQGCAQCLDSTRATPPQVQAAYRRAIYLLGGTAATFFIAGALFLRTRACERETSSGNNS